MTPRLLSTSSIVGTDVKNTQGESLGDIKDLMINTNDGSISYCVLSFGGFLGMGDKYFAVPFEAFTIDSNNETFVLNVSKEKLESAPGFDKDNWPSTASDSAYLDNAFRHYGYEPTWRGRTVAS